MKRSCTAAKNHAFIKFRMVGICASNSSSNVVSTISATAAENSESFNNNSKENKTRLLKLLLYCVRIMISIQKRIVGNGKKKHVNPSTFLLCAPYPVPCSCCKRNIKRFSWIFLVWLMCFCFDYSARTLHKALKRRFELRIRNSDKKYYLARKSRSRMRSNRDYFFQISTRFRYVVRSR